MNLEKQRNISSVDNRAVCTRKQPLIIVPLLNNIFLPLINLVQ